MRWRPISDWSVWGYLPAVLAVSAVWLQGVLFSQARGPRQLGTGKEIFEAQIKALL